MNPKLLNIVVTCTKQKRVRASKKLQLGSLKKGRLTERFTDWKDRLQTTSVDKYPVGELYCGDHWATVQRLNSDKFEIKIWVASAGYGLLELTDVVAPYAATFSKDNKDSVFQKIPDSDQIHASRTWWELLSKWQYANHPRSFTELFASRKNDAFLIVASNNYLKAIGEDLSKAAQNLPDRHQLSILSAGCKSLVGLSDCILPCDARLQHLVGGARRSLNTRVADFLVSSAKSVPNFPNLRKRLTNLMSDLPDIPTFDRQPVTDEVVKEFILRELVSDPSLAHTPLLRRFRDAGRACEQSRFRNLYQKTKAEIS